MVVEEIEQQVQINNLQDLVKDYSDLFLKNKENDVGYLYQSIIEIIDKPVLEFALEKSRFNQTKAAVLLGISRGTLRSKLKYYFGKKYFNRLTD